eukprot:CAMPEP_0173378106 /NCGR_PEP_ID=MMETSP1356-20130122/1319_1 /TAXON_ID=77927 ORGANISM="Hemiselmis virescens, Strain PCC157" /NCGR_SAMPLE_ID=MMETSP1356 /ASSEMBLY_ACC=CAM_ASM_000847 /LENGTH=72 /DNA_ID=CAMNT_0014331075 /DNA_START=437 /DNA_END=655 /DNA_ORIENTATION=+
MIEPVPIDLGSAIVHKPKPNGLAHVGTAKAVLPGSVAVDRHHPSPSDGSLPWELVRYNFSSDVLQAARHVDV